MSTDDSSLDLKSQVSSQVSHIESKSLPRDGRRQEFALGTVIEDVDEETAQFTDASIVISEELNLEIRSWVNKRVLPIMIVTYFFQTLDKGSLAFSSVMGLIPDNHLVGQQYALLGTMLYVGITLGEVPVNRLIQRFPVAKIMATLVFFWGVFVFMMAACHNWAGLMIVRFFLGLFEAGIQPCLMTITTMYFKREEHTRIIAYWYSMQAVQLMFAGLLSYGVSHITTGPVAAWQALFLVVGAMSVTWSIIILIFLPDSPMKAKCWTAEQKTLIIERLRTNELGIQDKRFKTEQLKEALLDPLVWCYVLLQFTNFIVVQSLAIFSNIIVTGLGFTVGQTQLLNLAQGAITLVVFLGSAEVAKRTNQTTLTMIAFTLPPIAGTVALMVVPVTKKTAVGLLIAFYAAQFNNSSGNLLFSLVTRNIAGQTKKVTTLALVFLAFSTGSIIGPQVFQAQDAPRYTKGFTAHVALYVFYIIICVTTRILLMKRNKEKKAAAEKAAGDNTEGVIIEHKNAFADLTDIKNPDFRYVF